MLSGKLQPKEQLLSNLGLVANNCCEKPVNGLVSTKTVELNDLQEKQKTWHKKQVRTFIEGKDGARHSADKLLETDLCSPLGCWLKHRIETLLNRFPFATTIFDGTKIEKFCSTTVDYCNQSNEADRLPQPSLRPRNPFQLNAMSNQNRLNKKRYCHTYHFTRQQRIDFCQTFDTGLNARARKLYQKVKPCSILIQRIPAIPSSSEKDNCNATSPSSLHVHRLPYGGDLTMLQTNASSESESAKYVPPARCLKIANPAETRETEANSVTCSHKDVRESSRVENNLASVDTKLDHAGFEATAFSSLSFDSSVSFVSLWMAGEKLPSVAFQCDICSEVICCNEDSKMLIEAHFADHGICNVTVIVEKDALGCVSLKIVEAEYPEKLPASLKAQKNENASCWLTSLSVKNLASSRIGGMPEATIGSSNIECNKSTSVCKARKRVHWSDQHYTFCDSDLKKSRYDFPAHCKDPNSVAPDEPLLPSVNSDEPSIVVLNGECFSVESCKLPQPYPLRPLLADIEQQKMPPVANDGSAVSQHMHNHSTKSNEQKFQILTASQFTKAICEADDYSTSRTAFTKPKCGALSHDEGIENRMKDNQNRPPVPCDQLDKILATDSFSSPKQDRSSGSRSSSSLKNVLSNLAQYQRQTFNSENKQCNEHQTTNSNLVHVLREFMLSKQPDSAKSMLTSIIAASTQAQPYQQQRTLSNNFHWYSPPKNCVDEPSVFTQVSQKAAYQSVPDYDVICLD